MIDGIGRNTPTWLAAANNSSAATRAADGAGPVTPGTPRPGSAPAFGALAREMAASPPVDAARVAALRTAIASGAYVVDPDAIAARMLAFDGRG